MSTAVCEPAQVALPRRKHRSGRLRWYALLAIAVLLVYGRVVGFDLLLWDDNLTIRSNRLLFPTFNWQSVVEIFSGPHLGMYMPVTLAFFGFEAWISQQLPWNSVDGAVHPWVFHCGNLFLHSVCVFLVYAIIKNLHIHRWAACLGALLFALHPLQAEPVAWATETKTLMAGMWSLAAIWMYLRHNTKIVHDRPSGEVASWRELLTSRYLMASVFFALALLSKPTAVVVPLLAGLIAWRFHGRDTRRQVLSLTPWVVLAAIVVVLTKGEQPDSLVHTVPGIFGRLVIAGDTATFYLTKLLLPLGLTIDYGHTPAAVLANPWAYVAWVVPVLGLVVAWKLRHRGPYFIAYLLFLVALLPVLGLIPFEFQNVSTVADRYAYLALLGPAVALAFLLDHTRSTALNSAVVIVLAIGAVGTHRQLDYWRNDEALFTRAVLRNPTSHSGLVNLALVRLTQASGDLSRLDQASLLLNRALEVAPAPKVQVDDLLRISAAMLTQGRVEDAVGRLLEAQRLLPEDPRAYSDLGDVLAAGEQYEAALVQYQKAIDLSPEFARPRYRSGDALRAMGRYDEAITSYEDLLEFRPNSMPALRGLAKCHIELGNTELALDLIDKAIACSPTQFLNHYEKGLLLFKLGNYDQAAVCMRTAIQVKPNAACVHNDLATALVRLNRLDQAAQHYRLAIQLDPNLMDARANLRKVELAGGK